MRILIFFFGVGLLALLAYISGYQAGRGKMEALLRWKDVVLDNLRHENKLLREMLNKKGGEK